jgi:hypothetical protein
MTKLLGTILGVALLAGVTNQLVKKVNKNKRKYKYKWITWNDDVTLPLLAKRRVRVKLK